MSRKVDKRNKLNDLNGRDWIISTKSVWRFDDYDMDRELPENLRHYRKLILFFTKKKDIILSPNNNDLLQQIGKKEERNIEFRYNKKVDFILYEIVQDNLNFQDDWYQIYNDLKYQFKRFNELLKDKKYFCTINRNFYINNSEMISFHHILSLLARQVGFELKGITIWVPHEKYSSHELNYPNKFIKHDNILIFRKEKREFELNEIRANPLEYKKTLHETIFLDSYILSMPPPRDTLKSKHPATFPESDVKKVITHFTKMDKNPKILDPFSGVGSTLLACQELNIEGWGIELTNRWVEITKKRFHKLNQSIMINDKLIVPERVQLDVDECDFANSQSKIQHLIFGDSRNELLQFQGNFFDFIITSPPYWGILTKKIDHKTRKERVEKGLDLKYSVEGEDSTFNQDLGNIKNYDEFLDQLQLIFNLCLDKLKKERYMAVIVSDFRDKSKFYLYHCDIAKILREIGFKLIGMTILHQNNKNLYPYGYPFAFVSNIHHQNIVIVKKED
ncbi:MAG: DNA methyltransferase [Candidatus Helarchaeota archaeon]